MTHSARAASGGHDADSGKPLNWWSAATLAVVGAVEAVARSEQAGLDEETAPVHHVVREAKAFLDRRLRQFTHIPAIDALRNDPVPMPRRYRTPR